MEAAAIVGCSGNAVLQACAGLIVGFNHVRRFREDCQKLCAFVQRLQAFLGAFEEERGPGWDAAWQALHAALLDVKACFDDCAAYGRLRSLLSADDMILRLRSVSQRLTLALQLIPIQKANASDKRLAELTELFHDLRSTTFTAVRAAEEQGAQLMRLMDISRVDSSKTQEMLERVLDLLKRDPEDGSMPSDASASFGTLVPVRKLAAEAADLKAERELARKQKKAIEEAYCEQLIMVIEAAEQAERAHAERAAAGGHEQQENTPPVQMLCPITLQLLREPVILAATGHTYERSAIEEWLLRGNTNDPVTGARLASSQLLPNVAAHRLVLQWLQDHPDWLAEHPSYEAVLLGTEAQADSGSGSIASRGPSSCKAGGEAKPEAQAAMLPPVRSSSSSSSASSKFPPDPFFSSQQRQRHAAPQPSGNMALLVQQQRQQQQQQPQRRQLLHGEPSAQLWLGEPCEPDVPAAASLQSSSGQRSSLELWPPSASALRTQHTGSVTMQDACSTLSDGSLQRDQHTSRSGSNALTSTHELELVACDAQPRSGQQQWHLRREAPGMPGPPSTCSADTQPMLQQHGVSPESPRAPSSLGTRSNIAAAAADHCSETSGSSEQGSRQSAGSSKNGGMRGLLKKLQYTVVYDVKRC